MAKTLLVSAHGDEVSIAASATRYFSVHNGGLFTNSTEAFIQETYQQAGVLSNLYVLVKTNGITATTTWKTRKNGADGAQSVSIGSGATGEFEDTTNTDSVTAGDEMNYACVGGGSGTSISIMLASCLFDATSNTVSILGIGGDAWSASENSVTRFCPIVGIGAANATEANQQMQFTTGGTLQKFFIYVQANARTSTTTFKTRKNATDGSQSISVTASSTGIFEDTANTDTIASGDLVNCSIVTGTGAGEALTLRNVKVEFTTTDSKFPMGSVGATISVGSNTTYVPMAVAGNTLSAGNTESTTKTEANFAFAVSKLWVYCSAAGANDVTVTLRKNAADTALTVTVTGTGEFEDSTNEVSLVATDEINLKYTGTGATWTMRGYSVVGGPASAGGAFATKFLLMGVGK